MISEPSLLLISCGSMPFLSDLLILMPLASTVKPCVSRPLYGARSSSMQAISSDEWNHPRCWSWPSRYRSASGPVSWCTLGCVPRSTCEKVEPESNHTSRMSVLLV
ncbi:hypothetical protein D9M69_470880 [compost metagenome]